MVVPQPLYEQLMESSDRLKIHRQSCSHTLCIWGEQCIHEALITVRRRYSPHVGLTAVVHRVWANEIPLWVATNTDMLGTQ